MDTFIPLSKPYLGEMESANLSACVNTGWISSQGAFVSEFERQFADLIGAKYAVAVSNGTAALHLSLLALGIGAGDEVIVPNLTFGATANAVIHAGARPVLCDIDEKNWTIDCQQLKQLINQKTKAIIPVHLYGLPANMQEIATLAELNNLNVIEDCAQALGAQVNGRTVGNLGDCGCFSFFANKTMTTGEGGMVTTNDQVLWQKLLLFRDHGMKPEKRYWHEVPGLNYRMTNIQASLGVAQLDKIDYLINERCRINEVYQHYLASCPDISFSEALHQVKKVTWVTSILVPDPQRIQIALAENGVDSRRFFYPLHKQPPYFVPEHPEKSLYSASQSVARKGISLPTFVGLQDEQIKRICMLIKKQLLKLPALEQ